MDCKKYTDLYISFLGMDKKAQRAVIKSIVKDVDLNYERTASTLQFFIRRSCFSQSEKSRLLRGIRRVLRPKLADYNLRHNVLVKCDNRFAFRRLLKHSFEREREA